MNRRAFFTTLTAACAIPAISEIRKRQERWAILRLRDELWPKIREANAQLKAMRGFSATHGAYIPERPPIGVPARGDERIVFCETNSEPVSIGEIVMGEKSK